MYVQSYHVISVTTVELKRWPWRTVSVLWMVLAPARPVCFALRCLSMASWGSVGRTQLVASTDANGNLHVDVDDESPAHLPLHVGAS